MKSIYTCTILMLTFLIGGSAHAQTITNYTMEDGLPSDNVLCISADEMGNIWFGTQNGLTQYDGSTWEIFNTTTHPEIPHNTITAVTATSNGHVWIGTDHGASEFDGQAWVTYTTSDGLGSNRINAILEASNGNIWFAEFNGVTMFDGDEFTKYGSSDGLPFGGVTDIQEANNGDIIMASGLGGVIVYDGSEFSSYTKTEGILSNSTTALALTENGEIWIGTGSGVSVLNEDYSVKKHFTKMYTLPPPDTLNPVEDIQIDSRGNVWVGIYVDYLVTVGGVAMYNGNEWESFDESNGLAGPTIRALALDLDNNVWVGTSAGVSKISSPYANVSTMVEVQEFEVFPNPTNEIVNIDAVGESIEVIQLFNTEGKLVKEYTVDHKRNTYSFPITDLAPGVYAVKAGPYSKRLIKI